MHHFDRISSRRRSAPKSPVMTGKARCTVLVVTAISLTVNQPACAAFLLYLLEARKL